MPLVPILIVPELSIRSPTLVKLPVAVKKALDEMVRVAPFCNANAALHVNVTFAFNVIEDWMALAAPAVIDRLPLAVMVKAELLLALIAPVTVRFAANVSVVAPVKVSDLQVKGELTVGIFVVLGINTSSVEAGTTLPTQLAPTLQLTPVAPVFPFHVIAASAFVKPNIRENTAKQNKNCVFNISL